MDIARLLSSRDDADLSDAERTVSAPPRPAAMDIARLLTSDDVAASDAEPVVDVAERPPPTLSPDLEARAPLRRPTRRRRKPSLETLRAQARAFELAAANLPFVLRALEDGTADQDDHEDPASGDASRMRRFLRKAVVLTEQRQRELAVRSELLDMLKRHHESTTSLRKLMRGLALDDWFWSCERWRLLTLDLYRPLGVSECYRMVQDTLQAIEAFSLTSRASQSMKGSFFGWRDAKIVVKDPGYVHFLTRKTQPHGAIKDTSDSTWALYQDGDKYKQYMLGDNCELFHQILQRVTDDIVVMQTVEQYRGMTQNIHSLSIVFRVATESGYLLAVRCMHPHELESAMKSEGLAIGDNFFWCKWDVTQRDAAGECTEFQSSFGGYIGADYEGYARFWVTELVLSLVRAEAKMGFPLLSLEESNEEIEPDGKKSPLPCEKPAP